MISLRLTPGLQSSWKTCQDFARKVCAGRGCSHNHTHMQQVTESALLIACMEKSPQQQTNQKEQQQQEEELFHLRRIIFLAQLHDVADHKYEKTPGQLTAAVKEFVEAEFAPTQPEEQKNLLTAIEAISFSKEKKNGKRWFEKSLGPEWVKVRDIVFFFPNPVHLFCPDSNDGHCLSIYFVRTAMMATACPSILSGQQ